MKRCIKSFIVLTAVLSVYLLPNELFAWGQTGHRAVAEVAEHHLNKKAKKAIEEILGDSAYLPIVSTWMDDIKSDKKYAFMSPWHYFNIDKGQKFEDVERNPQGDILKGIDDMTKVLEDENSSKTQKARAIKILTHLIGDLHQPFHVGHKSDLGGNKVKVTWFGKPSNIHRVWDSDMIGSKGLSYTELAKFCDTATKEEVAKLQSATPKDMMFESHELCTKFYQEVGEGKLGYRYIYDNYHVVERRIMEAGVRLAGILNKALG
ncbi:S1/P1 nuclease [Flammeovirga sp. MY04]|uniref:S1/P1 nuclease n=1 Tax=Flammeovirga sp. MY04 TaxID=1191459 RepID=UPI0008262183|nr:S1/P1 nuclease [Flammeovirga sp. MY04]ANQ47512.2 S1/P1 nuclease [Flammeovirga sp. MY04]